MSEQNHGPETVLLTDEGIELLREFAPHFDEWPVPAELAALVAMLVKDDRVGLRTISDAVEQPLYVVTGWAAQGGHITEYARLRCDQIREHANNGARSLDDVADRIGIGRERVRQLTFCMPDRDEIYAKLRVRPNVYTGTPTPVQVTPRTPVAPTVKLRPQQTTIPMPEKPREIVLPAVVEARTITTKERNKLLELIARAANVPRNAPPRARLAITKRDQYVRKLYDEGISVKDLAAAGAVSEMTIRDWTSPAKQYRRQLITKANARKLRAKRL